MGQEINQLGQVTPDLYTAKADGDAALSMIVEPVERFRVVSFTLHSEGAVADDVVISVTPLEGEDYETILLNYGEGFDNDLFYVFPEGLYFKKGDVVNIACANVGEVAWTATFNYEIL